MAAAGSPRQAAGRLQSAARFSWRGRFRPWPAGCVEGSHPTHTVSQAQRPCPAAWAPAQEGGPLALIKTGDRITIDAKENRLSVDLSDSDLTARGKAWKAHPYKNTRGTLYKYIKNVKSASEGCVTDE